jgi:hypothetical protein
MKYLKWFVLACILIGAFCSGVIWLKWKELDTPIASSVPLRQEQNCAVITAEMSLTMRSYDTYGKELSKQTLYMGKHTFCIK